MRRARRAGWRSVFALMCHERRHRTPSSAHSCTAHLYISSAMWMDVYDREVAPQAHRAQAAILNGRAAELPPLLGLRCPPSRRSARKHIQPQLSSSPTFPCFSSAERRHDDQRASRPKAIGAVRAATTSTASSYDPTRSETCSRSSLQRDCGTATRTTRARQDRDGLSPVPPT